LSRFRRPQPRRFLPAWPLSATQICSLLLICLLAWGIVSHAAADILSAHDPEAALFWASADPRTLTSLARSELEASLEASIEAKSRAAAGHAARLLLADPLAPGALSLYGAALARLGKTGRAEKIFRVAAKHLPTDLVAHRWLYERALQAGSLSEALEELDILLRGHPKLTSAIGASVQALIGTAPAAEVEFARLLSTAPPWRESMLSHLAINVKDSDILVRLYGRLRTSAPPSDAEMRFYIDRLVRDRLFDQAYLAWLDHLPPKRLSELSLLYNSQFRHPISNLPFDWRVASERGVSVKVSLDEERPTLNVEFYGSRVSFPVITHLIMLPPGEYIFSGSAKMENFENERGLRWRIYCADSGDSLAATDLLSGTMPWRSFGVKFSVPSATCAAQWLVLEIPARIAIEKQASGVAGYAKLAIEKLDMRPEFR
jgi:tetratricopeptide (TPR) repeat protein